MKSRVEPDIINLLRAGKEMDKYQAAALAYCSMKHARVVLKAAHQLKMARIVRFDKVGTQWLPVYGVADGRPDAKLPLKLTLTEKSRKRRANSVLRENDKMKRKLRDEKKKANLNGGVKIPSLASMLQGTQ